MIKIKSWNVKEYLTRLENDFIARDRYVIL